MEMTDNQEPILSVGTRLRSARQIAGLSMHDVSQHIKLSQKQIDLIENDGFDELGLVFSRGFVRNYARLVGLDGNTLVAEMSGTLRNQAETLSVHDEHIPLTSGLSKYWLIMISIAITLVIGVPLLVYHWLSADDTAIKLAVAPRPAVRITPVVKPAIRPVPANTGAPQTLPPAVSAPTSIEPIVATPAAATTHDTLAMGRMQFQFSQDSWVEIRDGKQHAVLSHLYRAGETAELSGTPPLALVIGNAAHVTLKYNDQTVDLAPHTAVTVARLTLQ